MRQQNSQFGQILLFGLDLPQRTPTEPELVGDDPCVARIALLFATLVCLPSLVDRRAWQIEEPLASREQGSLQHHRWTTDDVDADRTVVGITKSRNLRESVFEVCLSRLDPSREGYSTFVVESNYPVKLLADVDPNPKSHRPPPPLRPPLTLRFPAASSWTSSPALPYSKRLSRSS